MQDVEDNENYREVSCCTAETLLCSLVGPNTFLAIRSRSKLLEEQKNVSCGIIFSTEIETSVIV